MHKFPNLQKRFTRLLSILMLFGVVQASGQTLQANYGAPATPVQVANGAALFKIKILGGATACAGPSSLNVTLPPGYVIIPGSVQLAAGSGSVSQTSVTNNTAVFSVTNIPAGPDSTVISYRAYAGCGVIGGATTTVSYTLNGCSGTANAATIVNAQNAQLNITNVTNSAYVGAVGDVFTRSITITNNGIGQIDTIYLNSINNSSLTVSGFTANTGTITATANGYRIVAPTADGHLAQNETVVVTETVTLTSCTPGTTSFKAWYGPSGTECSVVSNTATAGATVAGGTPNIVISNAPGTDHYLSCNGQDFTRTIRVVNSGSGPAYMSRVNIFCTGAPSNFLVTDYFNASLYATAQRLYNAGSFTYRIGSTGVYTAIAVDSAATYTVPASCAGAGYKGNIFVTLPTLQAGDTLWLQYTDKNCCLTEAEYCSGGPSYGNSAVRYTYKNACGAISALTTSQLLTGSGSSGFLLSPVLPGSIVTGHPVNLRFDVNYADNGSNASSTLNLTWTLPASLSFSGQASDMVFTTGAGVTVTPQSVNYNAVTKVLTVSFPNSGATPVWAFSGGSILLKNVVADCANGSTGNAAITFKAAVVQGGCTSGCTVTLSCQSANVYVICNPPCLNGGMAFRDFQVLRSSFGLPDNDNDRNADAAGSINESLIRKDLVFTGDTVKASFYGVVSITGTSPAFSNGYATFTTTSGQFKSLYANLNIYRAGSLLVNAANYPMDTANKKVDFSPATLAANGYPGYTFSNSDSVVIDCYLKVLYYNGSGNSSTRLAFGNRFYLSPVANPTLETDRYSCIDSIPQAIYYVPVYIYENNYQTAAASGCNILTLAPRQYVSVLSGNSTILTRNAFPYEFRQTIKLDTVLLQRPAGFKFSSLTLNVTRPNGTGGLTYSVPVNTVDTSSATWVFAVPAGAINPADEGAIYNISIALQPTCSAAATTNVLVTCVYNAANGYPDTRRRATAYNWVISYTGAGVNVSSASPVVTSSTNTAQWTVQMSNTSGAASANNAWFGKDGVSGLSVSTIELLSGPGGSVTATISPVNGVYPLGDLSGGATKYYRITATSTNCVQDSFNLAYGFNCGGYPASVGTAVCKNDMVLGVIQQTPALQLAIVTQPSAPVNLCDALSYEVDVVNSGLGAANTLSVRVQLPATGGLNYVPGTFALKYPAASGSYTALADANVTVVGTNMVFNIPAASLASLPGTGVFRIRFQLNTVACAFTSGEKITFRPAGRNGCNTLIQGTAITSNRINLNGVPPVVPVFTITSGATAVQACGSGNASSTYTFKLVNTGTIPSTAADGFRITLPSGWTMNTAVTYTKPPATGGGYNISPAPGVYDFYAGTGLIVGDSIVFSTTLTAAKSGLSCGNTDPIVESGFVQFTATCLSATPVIVCDMKQLLDPENAVTTINVQRPAYSFGAVTANGSGTHVQGTATLVNGNGIFVAQNVTLSLYQDVNADGQYQAGEPLLGSGSYVLSNTASQSIPFDITTNVSSNSTLNMVMVATFACACDTLQYSLANIALPIEFSYFKSTVSGCQVDLNWDYKALETPLSGFDIQRSAMQPVSWVTVATVPADQRSFSEVAPAGRWMYRLRANSGIQSAYSKTLVVQTDCHSTAVSIYPSPAKEVLFIELSGVQATDVLYSITDKLGRVVHKGTLQAYGKNQVSVDHLAPGLYDVQVNLDGNVSVKTIEIAR